MTARNWASIFRDLTAKYCAQNYQMRHMYLFQNAGPDLDVDASHGVKIRRRLTKSDLGLRRPAAVMTIQI